MSDFKTLLSIKKFISPHFTKAKATDCITTGAKKMSKEKVDCILVYKGKALEGIVTESDIIRKVIAAEHSPKKMFLKTIMTPQIIYIESDESLFEAKKIMEKSGVRHLVVKEEEEVIGTISASDLMGNL